MFKNRVLLLIWFTTSACSVVTGRCDHDEECRHIKTCEEMKFFLSRNVEEINKLKVCGNEAETVRHFRPKYTRAMKNTFREIIAAKKMHRAHTRQNCDPRTSPITICCRVTKIPVLSTALAAAKRSAIEYSAEWCQKSDLSPGWPCCTTNQNLMDVSLAAGH